MTLLGLYQHLQGQNSGSVCLCQKHMGEFPSQSWPGPIICLNNPVVLLSLLIILFRKGWLGKTLLCTPGIRLCDTLIEINYQMTGTKFI